jgi:hypothetical protein
MRQLRSNAQRCACDTLTNILWRENWNIGIIHAPVYRLLEGPEPAVTWLPADPTQVYLQAVVRAVTGGRR